MVGREVRFNHVVENFSSEWGDCDSHWSVRHWSTDRKQKCFYVWVIICIFVVLWVFKFSEYQ